MTYDEMEKKGYEASEKACRSLIEAIRKALPAVMGCDGKRVGSSIREKVASAVGEGFKVILGGSTYRQPGLYDENMLRDVTIAMEYEGVAPDDIAEMECRFPLVLAKSGRLSAMYTQTEMQLEAIRLHRKAAEYHDACANFGRYKAMENAILAAVRKYCEETNPIMVNRSLADAVSYCG